MRGRGLLLLSVQIAGLVGTGYVIWFASVDPRLRFGHGSLSGILGEAFGWAFVAWAWSAALVLLLSAAVFRNAETAVRMALRTSRTAVWFAPGCILMAQFSAAAIIPALALIIGATQLLYSQWIALNPDVYVGAGATTIPSGPFQLLPNPRFLRAVGPALVAALGLELGLIAYVFHHPLLAGFLFCATVATVTLLMLTAGLLRPEATPSLSRSILGVVLTVILAAGLTTVHILYRGQPGEVSAASDPNSGDEEEGSPKFNAPLNVDISDNVFPGVILWPEVKPYVTIVVPQPSWLNTSLASVQTQPYSIPFNGEYWMFKPPQVRPPKGAYFRRGTPLTLFYKTTDHRKMAMEAHQKLEHPIDLGCCRAIDMAISNGDRNPGTIALELVLMDTVGKRSSLSLGTKPLTVWPKSPAPVPETVEFPVPTGMSGRKYNEIKVVMHRDMVRMDKSARISIERFILVPGV